MTGSDLKILARGDREIVITRSFAAPPDDVFEAMTNPAFVPKWLLGPPGWSMPECTIDLREGGGYRYVWRNADGREMAMSGTFREIARPRRIVQTERFEFGCDAQAGEQIGTMALDPAPGGRTVMTLTVVYPSPEARDGALKSGMDEGLDHGYGRLDDLLAERASELR